jgi:two-component system, chemotaxis family, protein-glutamate methylesterase/glutaminase
MPRIRILVVDDSALVRKAITECLAGDPDIEVVGTAIDPYVARHKIAALDPDVLTLDLEMPRMDGLTFLKLIMTHRPMPVIVISSLSTTASNKALEALQAGAVDVLAKPRSAFSSVNGSELAAKIKAAAYSRYRRRPGGTAQPGIIPMPGSSLVAPTPPRLAPDVPHRPAPRSDGRARVYDPRQIILMGASTGGTEALKAILTRLSGDLPGICIVQHIPGGFSRAFAERLDQLCSFEVREAQHRDVLRPGLALVAPGGEHLLVRWSGNGYWVELSAGPSVHHQRPAVDVLFNSAVQSGVGRGSLALILTGMGTDGAAGLLQLRTAGAHTIAQDENSCVVFGMPREAIRMGAACEVLSLDRMAARMERHATEWARPSRRA